jgi:hypothetical protein
MFEKNVKTRKEIKQVQSIGGRRIRIWPRDREMNVSLSDNLLYMVNTGARGQILTMLCFVFLTYQNITRRFGVRE